MADTTVKPVRARLVRTLGNAAAAGAVAGVIAAVAARGAMRAFVVGVGGAAEFTVGGSAAILASGLLIGAGFGMAYPLLGRVPGPVLLRGLLFGVIGLVAVQVPAFAGGIDEAVGDPRLGFALFVPVPFIYGVVTALAVAGLERRSRTLPTSPSACGRGRSWLAPWACWSWSGRFSHLIRGCSTT